MSSYHEIPPCGVFLAPYLCPHGDEAHGGADDATVVGSKGVVHGIRKYLEGVQSGGRKRGWKEKMEGMKGRKREWGGMLRGGEENGWRRRE